jgi:hypothetical protein
VKILTGQGLRESAVTTAPGQDPPSPRSASDRDLRSRGRLQRARHQRRAPAATRPSRPARSDPSPRLACTRRRRDRGLRLPRPRIDPSAQPAEQLGCDRGCGIARGSMCPRDYSCRRDRPLLPSIRSIKVDVLNSAEGLIRHSFSANDQLSDWTGCSAHRSADEHASDGVGVGAFRCGAERRPGVAAGVRSTYTGGRAGTWSTLLRLILHGGRGLQCCLGHTSDGRGALQTQIVDAFDRLRSLKVERLDMVHVAIGRGHVVERDASRQEPESTRPRRVRTSDSR